MRNSINTGKHKFQWRTVLQPGSVIVLALVIWQVAVKLTGIESWLLPAPSGVLLSLWTNRTLVIFHASYTLLETILGFALAVVVGVVIAFIMDFSPAARRTIYPLLVISQTVPLIAIAPLIMLWFGLGLLPKVYVIALVCFFPISVSLSDGFQSVDQEWLKLMTTMDASKWKIYKYVKWPAALPSFYSGLRIAATYSVMGAVIAEWMGGNRGLGILLSRSSQSFLTAQVFATILTIVILSLLVFSFIELLARLTMKWYYHQLREEESTK
jgi:ABC-type nitrate/sulfonate/bicarbonate transport system permease component